MNDHIFGQMNSQIFGNFGNMSSNRVVRAELQDGCQTQTMTPASQPPVISALDNLDIEVMRLENEWMDLINRLSPVCRQETKKEAGCEGNTSQISCELESRIQTPRFRLARIAEAMASIRNNLCI